MACRVVRTAHGFIDEKQGVSDDHWWLHRRGDRLPATWRMRAAAPRSRLRPRGVVPKNQGWYFYVRRRVVCFDIYFVLTHSTALSRFHAPSAYHFSRTLASAHCLTLSLPDAPALPPASSFRFLPRKIPPSRPASICFVFLSAPSAYRFSFRLPMPSDSNSVWTARAG